MPDFGSPYVKMCIISAFPPRQFQHLRCAVMPCTFSNQKADSLCTWSHFNSHFDFYFSLLFWILWIVSRLIRDPFCQPLSYTSSRRLFLFCHMLPSQDSRFSTLLEERLKCRCSFLVALQRCPRQDAPWPFQQGTSRKGTASNGCAGSKASVVELSLRGARQDGKNELNFEIVQAQQTPTEPLWGRTKPSEAGKKASETSQNAKTFWFEECRSLGVLSVFGCLKIDLQYSNSHVEIRHDTENFMQAPGEQAEQSPVFPVFIPSEAPKWPSVHTVIPLDLLEDISLYTLVSGPTSQHFPMCPWTMRERHQKKINMPLKRR